MSVPPPVPPPVPEFRLVPPPADGLAGAFREAAARRRRKAATTGSVGVLGAAIVFATLTGGSGQVLTQDDPLPPAQQDRNVLELLPVGPTPAASQAPGTAARSPRRVATGPASAPRSDTTTAPGGDAPRAAAARKPPVARPQAPTYRVGKMSRTNVTTVAVPGLTCTGTTDLCGSVGTAGSGSDATLTVTVCNTGEQTRRLDFPATDEVDIAVSVEGRTLWRWGLGRTRVTDPHQVPLSTGECLYWTTPWDFVDQSGGALPAGTYDLVATVDSPDAVGVTRIEGSTQKY